MNDKELSRLTDLVNDLNDARQAYDDAVVGRQRPQLGRVMQAGDNLSNVAYELHNFLVLKLTRVGGL
jgi:hypothetical protein